MRKWLRNFGFAISIILIIISIFLLIITIGVANDKDLMTRMAKKYNQSLDTYIRISYFSGMFWFSLFFIPGLIILLYMRRKTKKISVTQDEAIKELNLRYAKGEITKEQFDQNKKDIEK